MVQKVVDEVVAFIKEERVLYKDYIPNEAIAYGDMLHDVLKNADTEMRKWASEYILGELPYEYPYPTVWWYSVVCSIYKDSQMFCDFIKYVKNYKNVFSASTLYFLFCQLACMRFCYSELDGDENKLELWRLLLGVVEDFESMISVSLEKIPHEKRNSNLVVVLTQQLIAIQHGPTKTALDRCKALMKGLNKKVILINTAECLSMVGEIPFMGRKSASYDENGVNCEYKEWKGIQVPYFQCEKNMPNVEMVNLLLTKIREMAPCRIVDIGGASIVSCLADKIVPVLTVGLGPSDLEYTRTSFQTLSRKITDVDRALLKKLGLKDGHIIESIFTSSLKPQSEKITKADLDRLSES